MTTPLRITAVSASLLVLFSSTALGQTFRENINGLNPYALFSGRPVSPTDQTSQLFRLQPAVRRLPATSNLGAPMYLASQDLDVPYTAGETILPVVETCNECFNTECQCGTRWVMSADALWMSRSRANPQSMILSLVTVGESFNASELQFEARSGFRASWGYDLADGRAVELSTLNVYDQPATANVSGTDLYYVIHNSSPPTPTDGYSITYMSNLHSGELNWWLKEKWRVRPMIGVRWLRVREEFSITDTVSTSQDMASAITNDLVGAQIGFKTRLWNGGNWLRVEAALKGGIFENNVDYRATEYDDLTGPIRRLNRYSSSTSLAGEFIVSAVIQCCPNVAVRFGYHGLWMSEIGFAPNQANQSDFATGVGTDNFEPLSFNGGFVGVEANW